MSGTDKDHMRRALAEARKCRPEDNRIPYVGAVAVQDGRVVKSAYRGKRGFGKDEHAEFILLDKSPDDLSLAGATIYVTLEPCTSRGPDKRPCVKRLIRRKVLRVVIGMLDPNQVITGKGILELRRHNVQVDLATFDVMAEIEDLNRNFIDYHDKKEVKRRKRIAVAISAFERKQFFSDLLHYILIESARNKTDGIVKIPKHDYSALDQDEHFDEILCEADTYRGAIVVPIEPQNRHESIRRFCDEFRKPVVFVNVEPFEGEKQYPKNSCYIGFDNSIGGRLAGEELIRVFEKDGIHAPHVLIIGSNVQMERQSGCRDVLLKKFSDAKIHVSDEGRFDRQNAKQMASEYLHEAILNSERVHGVFCTNDEMALGVIEAVAARKIKPGHQPAIVGYDGIQEAIVRIARGSTIFRNTVVQDTRDMAEAAVDALNKMAEDKWVPMVLRLLPELYRQE